MILLIISAIMIGYCGLLFLVYFIFNKKNTKSFDSSSTNTVNVIVPHRDDQENLKNYLAQIKIQNNFEAFTWIISEDGNSSNYANEKNTHFITNKNENYFGKKAAIENAIANSKSDYVIINDTDVVFHSNQYFSSIKQELDMHQPDLWIGLYQFIPQGHYFLDALQLNESRVLQMMTYSFAKIGHPILCSGTNMAYARETFERLQPYKNNKHIMSGDDMFLLDTFRIEKNIKIFTSNETNTVLSTITKKSWNAYFHQRLRWIKKTKYLKNYLLHFVSTLSLSANIACMVAWILFFRTAEIGYLFILLSKTMTELLIAHTGHLKVEKKFTLASVLLSHFYGLVLIYMLIFGLANKTSWKGRQI
jgi:poly-beta-1,6-N-acetyl-D-glucosamine synthase